MGTILTDELSRILEYAADEAMRTGFMEIGPDHLLLAVLRDGDNEACDILAAMDVDMLECKHFIESRISRGVMVPYDRRDEITFSRDMQNLMNVAMLETSSAGNAKTGVNSLLSALMKISVCAGRTYLREVGVSASAFVSHMGKSAKTVPVRSQEVHRFIIQTNPKNIS